MKNKKAQVLILSLWILIMLAMLAVSIGRKVSLALYQTKYQRERLKASFLAKAGLNLALLTLENDANQTQYDALTELWANDEDTFKEIKFDESSERFAQVSYTAINANGERESIYGIEDEERRININSASEQVLITLCKDFNIGQPDEIDDIILNMRIWRGDSLPGSDAQGYAHYKKAQFSRTEEVIAVLENFYEKQGVEDYRKKSQEAFMRIKDFITVHPSGGININTADRETLQVLASSVAQKDEEKQRVDEFSEHILEYRSTSNKGPFKIPKDINDFCTKELTDDNEKNICSRLSSQLQVKSNYFKIKATGHSRNITNTITAIYNRDGNKIVSWHQN